MNLPTIIVILILSVLIIIGLGIAYYKIKLDLKHSQDSIEDFSKSNTILYDKVQELAKESNKHFENSQHYLELYQDQIQKTAELQDSLENKNLELLEMNKNLTAETSQKDKEEQIAQLNKAIEARKSDLEHLNEMAKDKNISLEDLETKVKTTLAEWQRLVNENKGYEEKIQGSSMKLAELRSTCDDLIFQLDSYKTSYKIAVKAKYDLEQQNRPAGWEFTLVDKEHKLIELMAELAALYPELRLEFAGIEWKKIWLPKIQDLCNREGLNGKRGIYKLTLIDSDGDELASDSIQCYVGQATNIKERWYQHIKKMVGVDNSGSEKLYSYRPNELRWEVLEEVNGDQEEMNEKEHYWIDFYSCKEYGLNKKR